MATPSENSEKDQAVQDAVANVNQATAAGLPTIPLPLPASNPASDAGLTDTDAVQDVSADENGDDIIEKEWVDKAKQTIARTSNDPYQLSEQLTELKADYLKKRHNKVIKLGK